MMSLMDDPEERLDLVNNNDEVIGTIRREEIPTLQKSSKGYVRAVGIFLENSTGRLWIPMRQPHKKIAPNGLDFSAAEHVKSGESYDDAVVRGLREELNIDADKSKLTLAGKVKPFAGMPYFHPVYIYPYDSIPAFSIDDFSSYEWLTRAEVEQKLQSGIPAKGVLFPAIRLLMKKDVK